MNCAHMDLGSDEGWSLFPVTIPEFACGDWGKSQKAAKISTILAEFQIG